MINEIEFLIQQFNDIPVLNFIINLGLLLMTVLAGFEAFDRIIARINKPKLKITSLQKHEKDPKNGFRKTEFIFKVTNNGKNIANNCKLSMKITAPNNISIEKGSEFDWHDNYLPIKWSQGEESMDVISIHSKNSFGIVKVPFEYSASPKCEKGSADTWGLSFNSVLDKTKGKWDYFERDDGKNQFFHFLITVSVNYDSGNTEKQFKLRIRTYPFPVLDEDIQFTSVDIHS